MKRILSIAMVIVIIASILLIPISADDDTPYGEVKKYGVQAVQPMVSNSYYNSPAGHPVLKSPRDLTGIEIPTQLQKYRLETTYNILVKKGTSTVDQRVYGLLKNVMQQMIQQYGDEITLDYEDSLGFFYFGYLTDTPYETITVSSFYESTNREAFMSSPYEGIGDNTVYKLDAGEQFRITVTLNYVIDGSLLPTEYNMVAENTAGETANTYIDSNFVVHPCLTFNDLQSLYMEAYGEYCPLNDIGIYIRLQKVSMTPYLQTAVQSFTNRQYNPVCILATNYYTPLHNSVVLSDDQRYYYSGNANCGVSFELGNPYTSEEPLTAYYQTTTPQRPSSTFDIDEYAGTFFYYMNIPTNDIAQYRITNYRYMLDYKFTDNSGIFYRVYYRCSLGFGQGHIEENKPRYFDTFPISFSAWILQNNIQGSVTFIKNDEFTTGVVDTDSLYKKVMPEFDASNGVLDGVVSFFGSLFVDCIPNIINNCIVWLMCDSPLLSDVTAPLFLSGKSFVDIITPTLKAFGTGFILLNMIITVFVIIIVKRWIK